MIQLEENISSSHVNFFTINPRKDHGLSHTNKDQRPTTGVVTH